MRATATAAGGTGTACSPRDARRRRARERLLAQAGVRLLPHAVERAAEQGFSHDEVLRTVASPEQTYTCPADRYGPNRRIYQRGRVAVVVNEQQRVVVTVLPRVQERWEHQPPPHARAAAASGPAAMVSR
jgi:hypothetical protein